MNSVSDKEISVEESRKQTDRMISELLSSAVKTLIGNINEQGLSLPLLTAAMHHFTMETDKLPAPPEIVCGAGCDSCCHLRVSTSIAEVLVITGRIRELYPQEIVDALKIKIGNIINSGDTLELDWWLSTSTPCPFLDKEAGGICAIYDMRPFTCRGHHSTDMEPCITGFLKKKRMEIPCFPVLRKATDLYSTAFISAGKICEIPSYEVGFVAAMNIALNEENAAKRWFDGEDLFRSARLSESVISQQD